MSSLLTTLYPWLKSFHILAVIAWMAGMLYLPRLYVYHMRAVPGGELEDALKAQERRLLKFIVNPSMIATWTFGLLMIAASPALLSQGWLHAKLTLVLIISGVHGYYAMAFKKFARGERPRTEKFWRIVNEIPYILAIPVVILVVMKPF